MSEFYPHFNYDEGAAEPPKEPDESSVEDVAPQLDENDRLLREAGHIPKGRLPDEEIRSRIRDRVNELERDDLEISEKGHQEIRDFLAIMRIPGAESASAQEIEILWRNLNRNPSLVKDFTLYLINRKTKNFYSEYPLLPNMRDLLEFADNVTNADAIRPQLIKESVKNMEMLYLNPDRIRNAAMSQSEELAEGTRFLGWLAGMPFMRGAQHEIKDYMRDNDLDELTIENIAHVFIIIVGQNLNVLSERTSKEYGSRYRMDQEALNFAHGEVLQSMGGIQDLLFKIFIEK